MQYFRPALSDNLEKHFFCLSESGSFTQVLLYTGEMTGKQKLVQLG